MVRRGVAIFIALLVDVVILGAFVLLGPAQTRVTPLWSRTQPRSLHPPR